MKSKTEKQRESLREELLAGGEFTVWLWICYQDDEEHSITNGSGEPVAINLNFSTSYLEIFHQAG